MLDRRVSEAGSLVSGMIAAIRYRGPDDSGVWCDPMFGLALGHARLSILDLSQEGHQPLTSSSGRFVLTCNGEVYNYAELRSDLEVFGTKFRGHTDTEVMLATIQLTSPWKRTTGEHESVLPASWSITWMDRRVVGGEIDCIARAISILSLFERGGSNICRGKRIGST